MNLIEVLIALSLVGISAVLVINFENIYSHIYFSSLESFNTTLCLHNALLEKKFKGYVSEKYKKVRIDIITIPNLKNPFYRAYLNGKYIYEAR